MKNRNISFQAGCWIFVCALLFTGCSKEHSTEEKMIVEDAKEDRKDENKELQEMETGDASIEENTKDMEGNTKDMAAEPEIVQRDWSEYFNGQNGTAVIYDASDRRYTIYNDELAATRRSPCSTFKIISSLIALEHGILKPRDSVRTWSGEIFWNEDWNKDIDFGEAFRTSCVWYFRQLADDIGKDRMQKELKKISYGNCDISDWEGRLNTNNNNRSLTGFWLESSLLISPKEQTEVMERIFGENSEYSKKTQKELKQVMLVTEQERTDISVYGKTGMGMKDGIVVDAWFTGFAETAEGKLYVCVRLGSTDRGDVSSLAAKEIAIQIVSDMVS